MMTSRIKTLLAACLLFACNFGHAEDLFTLGTNAWGDGMYVEAAAHWQQSSTQGHGPSQFNLAILYEQGIGVEHDYVEALRLYTLAAKNGVVDAQFSLANILLQGTQQISKDLDQAIYWYVQAADSGHSDAQFRLGSIFVAGELVQRDIETGVSWLELAASNHHLEAESLLRRMADEQTSSVLDEAWLLDQDPQQFTVELYSAPTRELAFEFVIALDIQNAAVFSSSTDLHHVAAGQFRTQQQATDAIAALPVALRARLPKVRKLETIQELLSSQDRQSVAVSQSLELPASDEAQSGDDLATVDAATVNDEQWIKSRNPDRYTAVLFSAVDQSQAMSFATSTGLQGGAIYQAIDGQFRVLGGLFENLVEAQEAISRLPSELRALSPQAVKFSHVFLEMVEK